MSSDGTPATVQAEGESSEIPHAPINSTAESYVPPNDYNEVHPIEHTAHSLLSGPLDSLNENFEHLNQSQLILLTRLRIIEDRLQSFKSVVDNTVDEKQVANDLARVSELKRRLTSVVRTLKKVEQRVERVSGRV